MQVICLFQKKCAHGCKPFSRQQQVGGFAQRASHRVPIWPAVQPTIGESVVDVISGVDELLYVFLDRVNVNVGHFVKVMRLDALLTLGALGQIPVPIAQLPMTLLPG